MATKKDTITIGQCPLCKKSHTYELEILRSVVVYNFLSVRDYEPKKKSFTRLFSCPETKDDFQASFVVIEYFGSPIESVKVAGLADEAQDE